ncbi:hypothetical protein [Bartonella mastomydis]|uniref:hypothetical protein n=1 Tax=Bartonella mastomydis TaxID=1820002 RepID=UPI001FE3F35F|nr:hypothetical protein [Bartonella mastomydis]
MPTRRFLHTGDCSTSTVSFAPYGRFASLIVSHNSTKPQNVMRVALHQVRALGGKYLA